MLKCEYPEGCRLDLWAKVIKAKYIEKGAHVLKKTTCIPTSEVGGYVSLVDDFKIKVNCATEMLNFNKVKIMINFDLVLIVVVGNPPDTEYQIFTICDNIYEDIIELNEFDPPLTLDEFRSEVDQSELLLCNWDFDYDIKGACEEECSPCRHHRCEPVPGTCIEVNVYVDIIDKLGKMHDIIVYGELDPEVEC